MTVKKTAKRTAKRTAPTVCARGTSKEFYKTMRGCRDGERKGSYGKLNYRSVKVR